MKLVEREIAYLQESEGGGYLTQETKTQLEKLENKKRKLLMDQEEVWCLKSRVILLESGDENTKFFSSICNREKIL